MFASILSYLFSSQHSESELAYFLYFMLLVYIAFTFYNASKNRHKEMQEEYLLIFGKEMYPDKLQKLETTPDFDDLMAQLKPD